MVRNNYVLIMLAFCKPKLIMDAMMAIIINVTKTTSRMPPRTMTPDAIIVPEKKKIM